MGSLWFQIAVALYLQLRFASFFFRRTALEEEAYSEPVLFLELLEDRAVAVFFLVHLAVVLLGRKRSGWQRLDPRGRTRWFVFWVAGIFVWTYVTGSENLYFGQTYPFDRCLILLLWGLAWWHPGFVGPLLALLLAVAFQGYHPLPEPGWMWPDKRLPLDALFLFQAVWWIRTVLGRRTRSELFPLLALCLTASHYAHAGLNKILLGPRATAWVLENDLSNLLMSSHLQGGWLGDLAIPTIVALVHAVHAVRIPMAIAALAIELSGFAILVSWRATKVVLLLFVTLHLGILGASGIFFWKWILFDIGLLVYLVWWRRDRERAGEVENSFRSFRLGAVVLGTLVIAGAPLYFRTISFAWFDTRLVNHYLVEGVGESGATYILHPRFFAPYDLLVQQSRFYYTTEESLLVGTYGTTMRYEVFRALQRADPEELPRLRRLLGYRVYEHSSARRLEEFLRRSVDTAQRRGSRTRWYQRLGPPYHFRSSLPDDAFAFQETLRSVRLILVESLYDGEGVSTTRRVPVLTVNLDEDAAPPGPDPERIE